MTKADYMLRKDVCMYVWMFAPGLAYCSMAHMEVMDVKGQTVWLV